MVGRAADDRAAAPREAVERALKAAGARRGANWPAPAKAAATAREEEAIAHTGASGKRAWGDGPRTGDASLGETARSGQRADGRPRVEEAASWGWEGRLGGIEPAACRGQQARRREVVSKKSRATGPGRLLGSIQRVGYLGRRRRCHPEPSSRLSAGGSTSSGGWVPPVAGGWAPR